MSSRVAEGRLEVLQIYRLLQYVHKGDKVQIEKMVNYYGENLFNLTEPQDGTGALHVAVSANNEDLVSFLLSQGAHPNIQDKKGRTPVMLAAELGNDAIVTLLAESNADMRLQDTEGKGVLFYCIYPTKRHTRCLQVALKHQADVNSVSAAGTHIFQLMTEKTRECTPLCLIMLEGGADPNATNMKTGVTALMEAAKGGSLQLVKAILQCGGNPHTGDRKHFKAVHYAAMGGFFEVIQVLSAYTADMNAINLDGCTALHYAARAGNANCCKFLAQRGCNPKLKNQDGLLPRLIAKDAGQKAAAKELRKAELQQGKQDKLSGDIPTSNVWALNLHDWSHVREMDVRQAFGNAADTVTTEMFISVLEELKAPVEIEQLHRIISAHDKGGEGCVSINDFIKGVKYIKKPFLLSSYMPKKKKGEKVAKGKKKGKPVAPLPICILKPEHMARRADGGPPHFMIETPFNCSDIRRFDRDHPPEHPIMNDSGWYVEKPDKDYVSINYCVRNGDLESLDLAFSRGVPVDVKDEFYKSPLMVACSTGNYEVAQYLLSRGADVTMRDNFFWTPLHHAAFSGQVELIELVLKAGADVDARGLSGETPLMGAIQSSRPSCVDSLIKAGANVNAANKAGHSCLTIARDFGDSRIIDLVKEKIEKENAKGKGGTAKKSKEKVFAAGGSVQAETSTATGKTSVQKDTNSIILQNTRISTGKANTVDVTFVPKTVWGKPPTTSQLMSKIERRKELLSLEVDFDDFMVPFSQDIQKTTFEWTAD